MYEIVFAVGVFVILIAASLGTLMTYEWLPPTHREEATNGVVRLVANIFVVMTSLVLGLMINSAKNTFEAIDHDLHIFATDIIVLDRTLRDYGADADPTRQKLIAYMERAAATAVSPKDDPLVEGDRTSERMLDDVGDSLSTLTPSNDDETALLASAKQQLRNLVEQRWTIIEHTDGTIPVPLIAMLVAWLVLIFASFGYRAPKNAVVVTTFIMASLLISTSLYLIIDMDVPFSGPIQISEAPLKSALAELQH